MLLNLVRAGGLRRSVAIVASLSLLLAPACAGSASAGGGDTARTGNTTANARVGAPPTVVVTSSLNASFYLQLVTFKATVTPLDATGPVTFMDGAATLGTATLALSGGVNSAALAFTDLSIGSHPITAVYGGVTSAVLTQAVDTTKLKLIKVICPSYTDVPANENYDTLAADNTGGHTAELNHTWQTTLTAESDKPASCRYAAGWAFNLATDFTSKSENTPLGTATTGADGTVTIDLNAAQLAAARHGGGPTALSVWETTKPDYGFGGIRCYTDILYSDNQDAVYDLPIDATEIYCMAFNVPVLTLTKTPSPTKFDSTTGTVTYSYTVTNTGGPTVPANPLTAITVTDDKINGNSPFSCGPDGTTLAYGESVTCTASYTILPGDLTAGSVKNTATAHARLVETAITSNTVTATIVTKPTLTITASSATVVKGSPIPAITASYSGFVSPDDPSSLTGTVTCTTTATSSSPVGVYPSTCSGATSANYTIVYVAGTVTVTPTLVRAATATPVHTTTPPPTTVGDGPSGGTTTPILAFLICLAFAALGLLAVQVQRRALRR
jgi:hypothetical protein